MSANEAVDNFREYLRIPSVHPDVDYGPCVDFLKRQAQGLGLPCKVYEVADKKPIVVITWVGLQPSIPAVMLNSHMDVVPVFEESWKHKPFAADMDDEGNIYARGAQDMKCVGIQYLEVIRRLKQDNVRLRRTLHLSFVPDEEIGGATGMKLFVLTDDFRSLNIGFSLDEGMASPTDEFVFFNGERNIWHVHVHCTGQAGHGSLLLPNTAGEKIRNVIDKFMDFRAKEKKKLESNSNLSIGDVTTINIVQVYGGIQSNVVPEKLTVVFDIRIAVTENIDSFERMVNAWCQESGPGITMQFEQKDPQVQVTRLDNSNPYWLAFREATDQLGLKLRRHIFPGGTDSRFVREIGVPAIGFSPINNTPVLLHDHDEFLNKDVFLRGIDIYKKIITNVANVEDKTG